MPDEGFHTVQDAVEAERVVELPLFLRDLPRIVERTRVDGRTQCGKPLLVNKTTEQRAVAATDSPEAAGPRSVLSRAVVSM